VDEGTSCQSPSSLFNGATNQSSSDVAGPCRTCASRTNLRSRMRQYRFLPEATSGEGSADAELEHMFDRVLRVPKS
jgi:hypothetical protein